MLSLVLIGVIIFTLALFAYSLVSHRLEGSMVTAPMIFVAIGLLVSPEGLDIIPLSESSELILLFAEIALVLILFSDAARLDFRKLKGNRSFPSRLLGIGLPLTIFSGAVIAILLFTDLSLPEAALIGVILAPTDAGLGQIIVNSPKVPASIRQALNVESGLNDGGAIPFFAFFLVLAQAEELAIPTSQWVTFALEQIGFGILVGLIVGLAGGYLVNKAIEKGLMRGRFQWIGFLALAVISYAAATAVGGSGFIAAFVGGLATSLAGRGVGESIIKFTSTDGEIFSLGVFFIFGVIAASLLSGITQTVILYAVPESHPHPDTSGSTFIVKNRITIRFSPFYWMVWPAGTGIDCPAAHNAQRSPGHTRFADHCRRSEYNCFIQCLCARYFGKPGHHLVCEENGFTAG